MLRTKEFSAVQIVEESQFKNAVGVHSIVMDQIKQKFHRDRDANKETLKKR